jgi:hypothetical protein
MPFANRTSIPKLPSSFCILESILPLPTRKARTPKGLTDGWVFPKYLQVTYDKVVTNILSSLTLSSMRPRNTRKIFDDGRSAISKMVDHHL